MLLALIKNISRSFSSMAIMEKNKLALLISISIVNGVIQTLGLVSIMPFIALISDPSIADSHTAFSILKEFFNVESYKEMLIVTGIFSFIMLILSNGFLVLNFGLNLHFFNGRGAKLSGKLLEVFLHKSPYDFYKHSTSDLSKMIFSDVDRVLIGSQLACLSIIADVVTLTVIMGVLIYVNPMATVYTVLSLLSAVLIIYGILSKRINQLGQKYDEDEKKVFSALKQSLNLYKEIKVSGKEDYFLTSFKNPVKALYSNSTRYHLLQFLPIEIIEVVVFCIILILASYLSLTEESVSGTITNIALYSFAAYKIIPVFKSLFESGEELIYAAPVLGGLQNELEVNTQVNTYLKSIECKRGITLYDITFQYPHSSDKLLDNMSLFAPAGKLTCIRGLSGVGKSTCLDLIMGVILPTSGKVMIDDTPLTQELVRSWQNCIGYVPQKITMLDDSIKSNVAFGVEPENIDIDRVKAVCEIASIDEKIMSLKEDYESVIGDGGIRLSGGEQQRIAIARALYHRPKCLILDEASNELDAITENNVIEALKALGLTIVFVSHKNSIMDMADLIIDLKRKH